MLVLLSNLLGSFVIPAPAQAQQQQPPPAPPAPSPTPPRVDQGLVRQLGQEGGGQVKIEYHRETGKVRFVGTSPGQPIARPARVAPGASPVDTARGFMAAYGPLFGVQDQSRELTVKRERADATGRSTVRLAQQYNGIPVFAGEVVITVDRAQNIQAATGELLPDIDLDTRPKIGKGEAQDTALKLTAREHKIDAGRLGANEPELWVYNPALVGDLGPRVTMLVWRLEVTDGPAGSIRQLVLVDAHRGQIALTFNQVADAKDRRTHTLNGGTGALPGTLICTEALACPAGNTDAIAAHKFAGQTYDFYLTHHGRDSYNGAGATIISTVDDGNNVGNASWNGTQMSYGDGFAVGDDVVAHEYTHAVTDFESQLMYFRQSGAINESLSDIWGELIDFANGEGNDTPGARWLMGEDIPIGAIRNMANPPAFNDPDRMTSALFHGANSDNGGVHINSGVNNKAAFLLVDGGTFNGKTVTALGTVKVAKIYYEVQTNLLTPGSDYFDLYTALQQACNSLVGTGVTTVADCQEVLDAIQAVEMHLPPTVNPAVQAPMCPAGQSPTNLFYDDFEAGAGNFTTSVEVGAGTGWFYPPDPDVVHPTSGSNNVWGFDWNTTKLYSLNKVTQVALPANAFMRFNHAWTFDTDSSLNYWDGGILEYTINNGTSWLSAAPLIAAGEGGHTGTLVSSTFSSNPLAGQSAWVGNSDYSSTRVNLSSLAGQNFRFRFRIGTDSSFADLGWFIDDIRIYTCGAGPAAGVTVTPTSGLTTTENGGTATFTVKLNTTPTANVRIDLASSDATEGRISQSSVLFTPLNALFPQTVTVTGVADGIFDANQAYTIVTTAVSTDASYNGLAVSDVSVTNTNVDVSCTPTRPKVTMTSVPVTGGRQVTLTAGAGNFTTIRFATDTRPIVNALIDYAPVGTGLTTGFTHTLAPPSPTVTFTVRRGPAPGQVMVPLIVTDQCGAWQTLVGSGGGPSGW